MITIDQLQIEIQDNSEKAASGIDRLTSALSSLRTITKGGFGLSKLNNDLKKVIDTLGKTNNIKFDGMAAGVDELKNNVKSVVNEFSGIGKAVKAQKVVIPTGQFDIALRSAKNVSNEMKAIAAGADTIRPALSSGVIEMEKFVDSAGNISWGLKDSGSELTNMHSAAEQVSSDFKDAIGQSELFHDSVSGTIPEFEKIHTETDNVKNQFEDIANSAENEFQRISNAAKELGYELQKNPKLSPEYRILATEAKNLGYSLKKAGNDGEYGANRSSSGIKRLAADIKGKLNPAARSGASGMAKLAAAFKRIIIYRVLRTILSEITQAAKEGLSNLAQYSSEANASMSALATSSLYLKNSFGAMLAPLLNAILPGIKSLTSLAVMAANAVNQLVSALQGKTIFTKAKEYVVDYAAGLDKATGAAKNFKRWTAGFDQLNIIPGEDAGGGGGGAAGMDFSQMFEEAEIDSKYFKFINWVKDNLDEILKIAMAIGIGILGWQISSLFVGGISGLLAKLAVLLARLAPIAAAILTIAGVAGLAYGAMDAWGNGIDWQNLLIMIGGMGLLVAGLSITFGSIGAAVGLIVGGLTLVVVGIKDAIEGSKTLQTALAIIGGILAVAGGIALIISSWIPLLVGAIVAAIAMIIIYWDEVKAFFINLGTAIGEFFSGVWDYISSIFAPVAEWVNKNIVQPFTKAFKAILDFVTPIFKAIGNFFNEIWKTVEVVASGIWKAISSVFNSIYTVVSTIIKNIVEIIVGIGTAAWSVVSKIAEIVATVVQVVWATVSYLGSQLFGLIKDIATWVWVHAIQPVTNFVGNLATNIFNSLAAVVSKIREKVITPVVELFSGLVEKVTGFFTNIGTTIANAVSSTFKSVMNGAFSVVETLVNGFINGLNSVVSIINKIPGVNIRTVSKLSIPRFEDGGFPQSGQYFLARENGLPEMVGSIGGRTAVANNDQIVSGITAGVYQGVKSAMNGSNNQTQSEPPIYVMIGDEQLEATIIRANNRYKARTGMSLMEAT